MNERPTIEQQVEKALTDPCGRVPPEPPDGQARRYVAAVRGQLAAQPTDRKLLERAALLLGRCGGDGALAALEPLLSHAQPSVRSAALSALRELKDPVNAHLAVPCLDDTAAGVRKEAMKTLAAIGDQACRAPLQRHATQETEPYLADLAQGAERHIHERITDRERG